VSTKEALTVTFSKLHLQFSITICLAQQHLTAAAGEAMVIGIPMFYSQKGCVYGFNFLTLILPANKLEGYNTREPPPAAEITRSRRSLLIEYSVV